MGKSPGNVNKPRRAGNMEIASRITRDMPRAEDDDRGAMPEVVVNPVTISTRLAMLRIMCDIAINSATIPAKRASKRNN